MTDQKQPKKVFGRGRGKPNRQEGPWARSKKLDESHDIRPPRKDGDEFVLSDNCFPPLPGAAATDRGQFDDNIEEAGTSQINGGVISDGKNPESKLGENPSNKYPTEPDESKEKGQNEEKKVVEQDTNDTDVISHDLRPKDPNKDKENSQQNANTPVKTENNVYNHQITVDIANSNLSPFAEEFVPRGLNMNPDARDFVPTFGSYDEANNNPVTRHSRLPPMNVIDTAGMLADLEETVNFCYSKLIETPASYDEMIGVVTPHYIKYMENPELPNEIVLTLYNYAIQDTRFAYFAIKILIHLIKMTCTEDNAPLRDKLLKHMQEEVQSTQNLRLTNPNVSCANEIQPFLTFLSELYIQLELGGRRLSLIGSALVETLRKLLTTGHIPIKERLKLIVNMIKLTGLSLDQDDPTILESLIRELGVMLVQERSNLDNPTFHFVNDIILLRNLRWGHVEPELSEYVENDSDVETSPNGNLAFANSNAYDPAYESNMVYSTGVFYGPDGHPIDSEEQLFLEVETNALNNLQIEDQGEQSPTSVEGFDEAYEEFLKTIPGHSPN